MEDFAGLLGKTMNSALYWLLHLIDTLLALSSPSLHSSQLVLQQTFL